jgi:tetratricopeptide (TPR) repeat protein
MLAQLQDAEGDAQRAEIMAQNGQWSMAAAAYAKAVERKPDDLQLRRHQLLALLEAGDVGGYRRAASDLHSRFGAATSPGGANNVAWYCVLGPDALSDREAPVHLADVALARYPEARKQVVLNTLGAALNRAGRLDEAIRRLDESVKAGGGAGIPQDWAFQAMAHHRRADFPASRRWLDKLQSYQPSAVAGRHWCQDVEIRILRREAQSLIQDSQPPDHR